MFASYGSGRSNTKVIAAIAVMCLLDLSAGDGFSSSSSAVVLEPGKDGIQRATITMDSYFYDPKELSVEAGKPIELTLHNVATFTPHTFVVDDPAVHVRSEVSAGDTQTVHFTPKHSGTVTLYCDKKLLFFKSHRERGQEGPMDIR